MGSAAKGSRSALFAMVAGYILFPPSTVVVMSFSAITRHLQSHYSVHYFNTGGNRPNCLGNWIGVDGAKLSRNMVVDCDSVDVSEEENIDETSTQQQSEQQLSVWKVLSKWFQGDFDNYAQVVEDRKKNLLPRESGGHEHFHCTLIPVTESTRLAAFFFDGNPDRIFRFRYYEMMPPSGDNGDVEMMLNTLHPDLEKVLKADASNPLNWPSIFENFSPKENEPKVTRLKNCEICWSFEIDPVQHSYLTDTPENDVEDTSESLHAIMVNGPTIVNSTIVPGMQIRIVDQLSLYQDVFYINDRGFDPITGSFIYGNHREVPYRLERVSTISPTPQGLERAITNSDLEWTLGPEYRSPEEYERKLESIGGPSVGIRGKPTSDKGTNKQ